ncbi:MAG: hypothetical protein PHW79_05950, partial [Candidatus Marinimicrobia bacterium]|nr:hypothetical protein [Candidatus Neomarinimicrobiota bacterium]
MKVFNSILTICIALSVVFLLSGCEESNPTYVSSRTQYEYLPVYDISKVTPGRFRIYLRNNFYISSEGVDVPAEYVEAQGYNY